jgi:probable H4MPT-linked C1 transfer pathway protein
LVAAANWHALATWAGRMAPTGNSLLIDVGSTTTDVIPIEDGLPAPIGRTDPERLASGELLYLGVRRTPLCALAGEIEIAGRCQGLARELFATTCDVWLTLGELPEEPAQTQTANGRPATRPDAEDRLARMFCADRTETNSLELLEMCRFYADRQVDLVRRSIRQVLARWEQPPLRVLFAGEGEFLARRAWHGLPEENPPSELLSLSMILGSEHSQGACAYALSRLASERF